MRCGCRPPGGAQDGPPGAEGLRVLPLLAGPFFLTVMLGNLVANGLRNIWTYVIIFCGHFTAESETFPKECLRNESRGHWYLRQLRGSSNISGGFLINVLSGNLSHQIEHHFYPDLPANRYAAIAKEVKDICRRYGQHYNNGRCRASSARWSGASCVTRSEQAAPPADAGHHVRTGIGQRGLIDSARARSACSRSRRRRNTSYFLACLLVAPAAGHAQAAPPCFARRLRLATGQPGFCPAFHAAGTADQAPRTGPDGWPRAQGCRHRQPLPRPKRSSAPSLPAASMHSRLRCSSAHLHQQFGGPGWKRPRWNSSGAPPFSCTSMMRPASSR